MYTVLNISAFLFLHLQFKCLRAPHSVELALLARYTRLIDGVTWLTTDANAGLLM